MNRIGPCLIIFSLLLNAYTVLLFFVFPFTDLGAIDWKDTIREPNWLHYSLFGIYSLLLVLTLWSFITASLSNPGYISKTKQAYDKQQMRARDRNLVKFLESKGLDTAQETVNMS